MQTQPRISIIAALSAKNRGLGNSNALLWKISDDLKRLKQLTTGHPIIMGRKTFESIGKPLPNRTNIIITRDPTYRAEGCAVTHSLEEALDKARATDSEEIFVFGGAQVYKQALPHTDRLYLTLVHDTKDADTFFPDYSEFSREIEREEHEENGVHYTWLTLERA